MAIVWATSLLIILWHYHCNTTPPPHPPYQLQSFITAFIGREIRWHNTVTTMGGQWMRIPPPPRWWGNLSDIISCRACPPPLLQTGSPHRESAIFFFSDLPKTGGMLGMFLGFQDLRTFYGRGRRQPLSLLFKPSRFFFYICIGKFLVLHYLVVSCCRSTIKIISL